MAKSYIYFNFSKAFSILTIKILLLVVVTLIVYSNSLLGEFQFDDYNVIVYNSKVHSFKGWLSDLETGIRPLLKFSYTINWLIDSHPFGFHLLNLIIHLCNVVLIYLFASKLLICKIEIKRANLIAFLAALLFAIHPIQTEAITYVSGRSTSMMAMFYISSLLFYIQGKRILSMIFFILALLTKEIAIVLPLNLLLIDIYRYNKFDTKEILKNQYIQWLIFALTLIAMIFHPKYSYLLKYSLSIRSFWDNILTQLNGIFYLITRLFVLNGMNIDPDLPVIKTLSLDILIKGFLFCLILTIGFYALRKKSILGFAVLWFFINIIPTNSIIPRLDVANDRQLYIASFGFFILFSSLLVNALSILKNFFFIRFAIGTSIVILSITLGAFTFLRNLDYKTEISLWEDTAKKSSNKARVFNNLGYAYYLSERFDKAEKAYKRAIELNPEYSLAKHNLLILRLRKEM